MSVILNHIHQDHMNMIRLLDLLEEEASDLAAGNDHDYTLMSNIVEYFNHYPERFHHPYEDKLFKWIGDEQPTLLNLIEKLRIEHVEQAALGSELAMFLAAIRTGHMVPRDTVVQELTRYIEVQRNHINKEEGRLLNEIENLLADSSAIEIPISDRFMLDPLFGDDVDPAFSIIADALKR